VELQCTQHADEENIGAISAEELCDFTRQLIQGWIVPVRTVFIFTASTSHDFTVAEATVIPNANRTSATTTTDNILIFLHSLQRTTQLAKLQQENYQRWPASCHEFRLR